jgi:hypothetical protein
LSAPIGTVVPGSPVGVANVVQNGVFSWLIFEPFTSSLGLSNGRLSWGKAVHGAAGHAPHRSAQTSRPTLRPESQPMTIEQYPVPMAHGHALLVRRTFFPVCMGRGEFRCAVVFSRYTRASTTSTRGPGFMATSSTNPFHCCCFVGSLAKADVSPPGRSVGISVLRRANVAVMACASRSHLKPYACASIQILQKSFAADCSGPSSRGISKLSISGMA